MSEMKKGLIKQSRTWKVIWLQLVIIFNVGVFIMLRKCTSLGHFVLWCSLLMPLFLTPKDMGSWLRSALLDCFLPLESGLEKFSPLRSASGGEEYESDCMQKPERERWGEIGEESLLNLTWLSLTLKESLLCFFGRSNDWFSSRI